MRILLYPLLFLFLITSCESLINSEPELPPITTEGKNIFGCLINGEVWLPKNSVVQSGDGLTAEFYPDDVNVFVVGATKNGDQTIRITVNDCCDDGIYKLVNESDISSSAAYRNYDLACSYETDSVKTGNYGEIEIIHFEPRKFIVAGTFEFTTVTEDCYTIRVTEGRFDVNYNSI